MDLAEETTAEADSRCALLAVKATASVCVFGQGWSGAVVSLWDHNALTEKTARAVNGLHWPLDSGVFACAVRGGGELDLPEPASAFMYDRSSLKSSKC